jgi:DNA-binding XRE family transcriptional regulator
MVNNEITNPVWPSPRLIRAARGLVGIDQGTLAALVGVTRQTVTKIEADESARMDPRRRKVLLDLATALEQKCDIEFIEPRDGAGEGVRFRTANARDRVTRE